MGRDVRERNSTRVTVRTRKKLIEVALPLEAVNAASALEKQPFTRRHPRSMHIWWARRPLAAARAVIFAQMVDDPSSWPERFPTEEAQDRERQRLFRIIEQLVLWENTTNEDILQQAQSEIRSSWRDACEDNKNHPRAADLFDPGKLPGFHDPFAGGGALPLEAQRLGLEAWASDLNPVAVLITKAVIEIPPHFAGLQPIGPLPADEDARIPIGGWTGARGLAEDVRRYGEWVRTEAEHRIGGLYPTVTVTGQMAQARSDLRPYIGQDLTVIAWLWARTVRSPDPAFSDIAVPLASTFMLSTKAGKEAYVEPAIDGGDYRFTVKTGPPKDIDGAKDGTKLKSGANFRCLLSGSVIAGDYIKAEGRAGRIGSRLMAVVVDTGRGRAYLPPTPEMEAVARRVTPAWKPDVGFLQQALGFRVGNYGMTQWSDLFTNRQLVALATFSDLVKEARERARQDARTAGLPDDGVSLDAGGRGVAAYADAIATYLGLATSRWADLSNTLCTWNHTNQNVRALFSRQAIPMSWDFTELSPFSKVGSWFSVVVSSVEAFPNLATATSGWARQLDASQQSDSGDRVISTDPPYYDNIGYADLSDFFYVWLRHSLQTVYPDLFSTVTTPKLQELVASPHRHGGRSEAETFFLAGMTRAIHRLSEQAHPAFPVTIYYAFKQSEKDEAGGTASTGWETFLEAVIRAGFSTTGTWPIRTERGTRSRGIGSNALASSIVLVCRIRDPAAAIATRRDFLSALKSELPAAVAQLQRGNVAPVDLAQAAIGPGMAIYTRFAKVQNADGSQLSVRDALASINRTLDEVLEEQEGDFDADTRWAIAWFEQFGFSEGDFGFAETLSKAKNTSVGGMVEAGIVEAGRGKVRLLRPGELPPDWDPVRDSRLTVWEATHHLMRVLDKGEAAAAELARRLGGVADSARDLAYRLYVLCERKKRAQEALAYNGLVQSWPEIQRLAAEAPGDALQQALEV